MIMSASGFAAKNHRILVIPGGGGTGIGPATVLAELEKRTGKRVAQMFDEIWGASIGAAMATLYADPIDQEGQKTRSAQEVLEFVQKTFSRYHRAYRIRKTLRTEVGETRLNETVIPVRILSAEVIQWRGGIWPRKTQLIGFNPKTYGECSLAEVASGSCTVYPFHPRAVQVQCADAQIKYCIDAGTEVCTEQAMNPLWHFIADFTDQLPAEDTISIYFLSNGWVRLPQWLQQSGEQQIPNHNNTKYYSVNLYNLDMQLDTVFQDWKRECKMGRAVQRVCTQDYVLCNLAGIGMIPSEILQREAQRVLQTDIFKQIVDSLQTSEEEHSSL